MDGLIARPAHRQPDATEQSSRSELRQRPLVQVRRRDAIELGIDFATDDSPFDGGDVPLNALCEVTNICFTPKAQAQDALPEGADDKELFRQFFPEGAQCATSGTRAGDSITLRGSDSLSCTTGLGEAPRFVVGSDGFVIDRQHPAGHVGTKVSRQKQAEHLNLNPKFRGGGYFSSFEDAQRVLDDFHNGRVEILGYTKKGDLVIRDLNVIGYNNNDNGYENQPTNVFHQRFEVL